MNEDAVAGEKSLNGIAVYPGIVIGKAHLVDRSKVKILYQYLVNTEHLNGEVERFEEALQVVEQEMQSLKNGMAEKVTDLSFILDSHLMILKDNMLRDSTIRTIQAERINAEWALKKSLEKIREVFDQIDDEYISNRISDVENVTERILRTLSGKAQQSLSEIDRRVIIVAHDLSPTDTTELNIGKVMGFITDVGGRTSHTAIMAQALEIPAVVGLESVTDAVADGDLLIVDGSTGVIIVNPDDRAIIYYQEKKLQLENYRSSIARQSHLPAVTPDGQHIAISANIEFLEEVTAVRNYGGEGIGLYRTEFLYLRNKGFPEEEDLFENYREIAELMAPEPVNIRTLDIGGDKFVSEHEITKEMNPALGLRAIRFCLKQPEIFKTQLRAILRASVYGNIRLIFPMISGLQELLDAKEILSQVKEDLDRDQILYNEEMDVGIMVEIPSAVVMDFFSIGTNDLIQYLLAIDRVNEHVAHMYQPFDPALIRMIAKVVEAARNENIRVTLCGEMAGDPLCVPILLGLGFDALSMNARSIPLIKKIVRTMPISQARDDLKAIMRLHTASAVQQYLFKRTGGMFPELREKGYL
ncbi:MAG: phosphoenolpyruvate--protein phosphotransferase [Desulfobacteraceae bacterium 4572_87]|nr:MAG: phosphoenolpyruvate--protein phosphotransferase [Desulfobacteraceae bacterium 4572_87]